MIGVTRAGQTPFAIRAGIVGEGDRLIGCGADLVGGGRRAVELIVDIGRDRVARIGRGLEVAARVVGAGGQAGIGTR